ncbi:tyrosine-protein phosphatase [Paenibacillus sp. 481]|uniref:tyrosine-protein phosphatase n=1 Tax=Paenibacillus sp. 481 TaxID=2835869 RepID=UPI001E656C49|nr:CpsB/CapC family capsule biosynthesis tyrosine phosphatase [Paenibacillus sp. 481]UHA71958.1 hypothetical protein KIK04_14610 [Paenibacillus sp. 481]
MIDIHCHLLPGIDDGPATEAEALRLAAEAVRQGVRVIIATPHHATKRYSNERELIRAKVKSLIALLDKHRVPLKVLPGQEMRLTKHYAQDFEAGAWQPLADSRYMLIEWPSTGMPDDFLDFVRYAKQRRLQVIVAHPERNRSIIRKPELALALIEHGVLFQLTAKSLLGGFGLKAKRTARALCRQRCVHFLASDAHHVQRRGFHMREGYRELRRYMGAFYAEAVKRNAVKLVAGESIVPFRTASVQAHHSLLLIKGGFDA